MAQDKPAQFRAWMLELEERTMGSKLELIDLSHNQVSDDGAVIVIRSLLPLRQRQRDIQKRAGIMLPDGRVRRVLPRIMLENNLVQVPSSPPRQCDDSALAAASWAETATGCSFAVRMMSLAPERR